MAQTTRITLSQVVVKAPLAAVAVRSGPAALYCIVVGKVNDKCCGQCRYFQDNGIKGV